MSCRVFGPRSCSVRKELAYAGFPGTAAMLRAVFLYARVVGTAPVLQTRGSIKALNVLWSSEILRESVLFSEDQKENGAGTSLLRMAA